MGYDLFISYSRRDNDRGRITELVEQIKTNFAPFAKRELVPFFDRQDIQGMQDWRQRILQGLRESRLLLACLSPSYLESEYCEWEFVEYLKYEIGHLHGFNGVAPVYFVQVPDWNDKDFDKRCAAWVAELRRRQNFDLRSWHDQGAEALRDAAVEESMGQLNRHIARTITRGERAEKSLGNVDAHNPHFIGRTANLRQLRQHFVTPGHIGIVTAVNGVGGLGKTALAIEYAHSFADEYGGGRWQVRCAGKEDLRLALAELAPAIGFEFTDDEKKDPDRQFDRTRGELKKLADAREPHRCLLILDNVDRPGFLQPAQVARLNGGDWLHVLATTRLGENELHGSHRDRSFLAVDELPIEDALALIESYQPGGRFHSDPERDAARQIVRLLGCFTLAVESAAVYLGQVSDDVTCAAFLARLMKEGLEAVDTAAGQSSEGVLHGEKRLSATLQPTLQRLSAAETLALEFAALLPPEQVPLPWVRALVAKTFPRFARDAEPGHADPWKSVQRSLFSLRLLQPTGVLDADNQPLVVRVHRLVQELVNRKLSAVADSATTDPASSPAARQQALDELVTVRVQLLQQTAPWPGARWEIEPLDALADQWAEARHRKATWLLNEVGWQWYSLAQWARAEPQMRRALAIDEANFGPNHLSVAASLNSLAVLLQTTNRVREAEPLLRRAIPVLEGNLGESDPSVATGLNNLAGLLQATGRLAEAEPLVRRALTINEASLGLEHPEVARSLNNLALLLQATNRLAEAEPLQRRTLAISEASLGPDHPEVAGYLGNLALSLQATNRFAEAEPLLRRALSILERSLGEGHPNVARSLNNLAGLLQATNRLAEAEALIRRALAIDEASFGPDHPTVALRLNNVAELLKGTNRLAEAEPLMRRHLEIFMKFTVASGHQHPHLQDALGNYVGLLKEMGQTPQEIRSQLDAVGRPFGTPFGDGPS